MQFNYTGADITASAGPIDCGVHSIPAGSTSEFDFATLCPLSGASNFGSIGFARSCTAESWLSNWSGLSSKASMELCGPDLICPVLMIEYTGDNSVFPSEADAIFGYLGTDEKVRTRIHGNHHGRPMLRDRPNGQLIAGEEIRNWLLARKLV